MVSRRTLLITAAVGIGSSASNAHAEGLPREKIGIPAPFLPLATFGLDSLHSCSAPGLAVHNIDIEAIWDEKYGSFRSGGTDLWVDWLNGSDMQGNGRFSSPFKTVKHAMQRASTTARRIFLLGAYSEETVDWTACDGALTSGTPRAIKIIAPGLTFRFQNPSSEAASMRWASRDNGFTATSSLRLHAVFIHRFGARQIVPYFDSQSDADEALYGWTQDTSTGAIYLCLDGINVETLKQDIELIYSGPAARISGALLYMKNIEFHGLTDFQIEFEGNTRPVIFMEGCKISYGSGHLGYGLKSWGSLLVTQNCEWSYNTLDGMNADPDPETGQEPWHVSIDDHYNSNGLQGSKSFEEFLSANPNVRNVQGSSYHQGLVVRINPRCADNYGQNIADTQTTATGGTWMVGAKCGSVRAELQVPPSRIPTPIPYSAGIGSPYPNIELHSSNCWLDSCSAGGRASSFGLIARNGANVSNCAFDGVSGDIHGTVDSYDPLSPEQPN